MSTRIKRKDYDFYDEQVREAVEETTQSMIEESPAEVETMVPETKNGIIDNSQFVRLRSGPNPEFDVIRLMSKGDRVEILGDESGYYKVRTKEGKIGYILTDFVKEV